MIDALGEVPHFGADEVVRDGITAIKSRVYLGDDAVLDGNIERARVRTIENARRCEGF